MNAKPLYKYLWELFHFATILPAAGISRSVWSAWSLLPLWCAVGGPKALAPKAFGGRTPYASRHLVAAVPRCAVSPICNRLGSETAAVQVFFAPAEYNSAIQQIENLRYAPSLNCASRFRWSARLSRASFARKPVCESS